MLFKKEKIEGIKYKKMKRTVIGILAHVDVGKTTLSEAMMFCSGNIRSLGRVDHGSAFLDNFSMERQRGITIFSKQAVLKRENFQAILLDTPGHIDFSAEMERTLDVLDCAILAISASSGIQSHTFTLWKLLREKNIPTFIFVNKMDQVGADKDAVLNSLNQKFGNNFVDFTNLDFENIALCDENLMEEYLESREIKKENISKCIKNCKIFPCLFGAALKLDGVEEFLECLQYFSCEIEPKNNFSAKVFKISRDEQGTRLTHLKITGGKLKVRDIISSSDWEEKVTQIRLYSGSKFTAIDEAVAGDIVAVVGLSQTFAGLGLGDEENSNSPMLEPVLTYTVLLPYGYDIHKALQQFKILEEEEPQLHIDFDSRLQEIRVQLMGQVQLEILQQLFKERFNIDIAFGEESILYKETIENKVEGVGHYEPLRHYSEVHLLLEPNERGKGIEISTNCHQDDLDLNWQRLILTHLAEKQHLGVLTGSPITDIKITLMSGKAHLKHTEGGDFRQATYRAVRQGLMQAKSVLLEPYYNFRLEIPQINVGRAMTDLQRMGAEFSPPENIEDFCILEGSAPVAVIHSYPQEVTIYTKGMGRFSCQLKGYEPCKNQEKIVSEFAYNPEADLENTPDSVFCEHGAGINVKWNEVPNYMHLPSIFSAEQRNVEQKDWNERAERYIARMASDQELMEIFERTYGTIKKDKRKAFKPTEKVNKSFKAQPLPAGPEYTLVDGYNIIFSWKELKEVAKDSLDMARAKLINMLSSYQGFTNNPVIVVFDAYRVKGNVGSVEKVGGLSIVYTKEAETADAYIEKVTYELGKKHRVRVATSDGLEQIIILGNGALRISANSFYEEVMQVDKMIRDYLKTL